MKRQWYVGYVRGTINRVMVAFPAAARPTDAEYGKQFYAVMGPFRTRRAARFMERCGGGNPHIQTVSDAERIAAAAR